MPFLEDLFGFLEGHGHLRGLWSRLPQARSSGWLRVLPLRKRARIMSATSGVTWRIQRPCTKRSSQPSSRPTSAAYVWLTHASTVILLVLVSSSALFLS